MTLKFKRNEVLIETIKSEYFTIGSGPKNLIILHGWDANINVCESFTNLITELQKSESFKKKYTILLPHFPGFGGSDHPPKKGWNGEDYTQWLEQFLEALEINPVKTSFFSHSFGGRILGRFLARHPEYTQPSFLSASAGITLPEKTHTKLIKVLAQKLGFIKKVSPLRFQKAVLSKLFRARDWAAVPETLKPTLQKIITDPDFRDILPNIQNPITLFWGAQDKITPLEAGKIMKHHIQPSSLVIFEDGRHGIHRTHAPQIAKKMIKKLT